MLAGLPNQSVPTNPRPFITPWHNKHPFKIVNLSNRVRKCVGCPFEFRDPNGPLFTGLAVQHLEKDTYFKDGRMHISTEANRYYHCEWGCLQARHPYVSRSMVHVGPNLILDSIQESHLLNIGMPIA